MNRIHRRLAVLACAGLLAPLGISSVTGAAIDQDLVVSATSGVPGDQITVSSATCPPPADGEGIDDRFLRVRLVSGTGSDAVMAGVGWGYGSATLILPDWADPADDAVIEASCVTATFDWDTGVVETVEDYDPVAFDLLPGAGAPTQTSTLSRDALMVGQSYQSSGTGCTGGEQYGGVELWAGADLAGRNFTDLVAMGDGEIQGGSFDARLDLTERSWSIGWSVEDGGRPSDIQVEAGHLDIPAGTYTSMSYCATWDDATETSTFLTLPPQQVEITGDAPVTAISMDVDAGTPNASLVGQECTAGDVEGGVMGRDLTVDDFDLIRGGADGGPSSLRPDLERDEPGTQRLVGNNELAAFTATPDADGAWAHDETADFEVGVLIGDATCGDPLADGFFYDLSLGIVEVPETPVTVPPTAPPSTVPATGAAPVTGTPTYAG